VEPAQGRPGSSAQDEINGRVYERPDVLDYYASLSLRAPEATVLTRYRDDIAHRRVLDLGCGTGRLAAYLRQLTDSYTGVDRSPRMLAHCRRNFAGVPFFEADMRDLGQFGAASFDAVFAVFNLFDAVSHEDRLKVFEEVRRVLALHGLLVFSFHNRNYAKATTPPHLDFKLNPVSQMRSVLEYFRSTANHRRIAPKQRVEQDYALVNDSGHNYAVLNYYITRDAQTRQLGRAGFGLVECLDERGRTLDPGADDSTNASLHFIARPAA
jgi:SAM-dependent methyltransferase